jgi:hypothetical protein
VRLLAQAGGGGAIALTVWQVATPVAHRLESTGSAQRCLSALTLVLN